MSIENFLNYEAYYVYLTTNLINNKTYIGKHFGRINDDYKGSGKLITEAFKKYGFENFNKTILAICYSKESSNIIEKEFIRLYRSIGKAEYNIADGGEGGNLGDSWKKLVQDACHTKEYSEKISHALKGHIITKETKEKISKSLRGRKTNNHTTKGYHWYNNGITSVQAKVCPTGFVKGRLPLPPITDEVRKKMSEKRRGRKCSEETKQKMKESAKFRKPLSRDSRLKISNRLHDKYTSIHRHWYNNGVINVYREKCPNGFSKGRILSEESKQKILTTLKKNSELKRIRGQYEC